MMQFDQRIGWIAKRDEGYETYCKLEGFCCQPVSTEKQQKTPKIKGHKAKKLTAYVTTMSPNERTNP